MPNAVICRAPEFLLRRILHCPTCKQRRRFIARDAAWYGITVTCCGCGDSWGDGERLPRPAARGWRKEASAEACKEWREAGPYNRAAHRKWLRDQFGH